MQPPLTKTRLSSIESQPKEVVVVVVDLVVEVVLVVFVIVGLVGVVCAVAFNIVGHRIMI